jgi:hypothetical protein
MLGGETNFATHQGSKAHKAEVRDTTRHKKPTLITSFFGPPKPVPPSLLPGPCNPIALGEPINVIDVSASVNCTPAEIINVKPPEVDMSRVSESVSPVLSASALLLTRLRALTLSLPVSVPTGTPTEPLALFSNNPKDLVLPGEDAREDVVDPAFNWVIGFGTTTGDVLIFYLQFHFECAPSQVEDDGWFCDDTCRTNSGFRAKRHRT